MQKGKFYIIGAAVSWGMLPMFSRFLFMNGYDAITVAAMRIYTASIIFLIIALRRKVFSEIKLKDAFFFIPYGVISLGGMYTFGSLAMKSLSVAMAVMLLYTAPAFVIVFSRIIYKEKITSQKLISLFLIFFGCSFVVRAYSPSDFSGDLKGITFGLLSGICYSTLTLFGRRGVRLYSSEANTIMPALSAAVFFMLIRPPFLISIPSIEIGMLFLGLSIVGSLIPNFLYLKGLKLGVEGGKASLMANIEAVVATIVGVVVFSDSLEFLQVLGMCAVIAGAAIQIKKKE
jgi:drug/metabolite transporter (DMT)-like permease